MNIEEIRSYALDKLQTTEGLKWGDNLCVMVFEKIFLLLSLDQSPTSASFKVSEDDFDLLIEKEGINQAAYFAKRQWVKLDDIELLSTQEWERYINKSYFLVASKLTKKLQKELNLI